MKLFGWNNKWQIFLISCLVMLASLGLIKLIKEESREIIINPVAPATSTNPSIKEIIEELTGPRASTTTDWSQKIAIVLEVPFVAQAPLANWGDKRQQNGCEEAVSVMAMAWVKGETGLTLVEAEKRILAIADYELKNYQSDIDTSVEDTVKQIFKGFWNYDRVAVSREVTKESIVKSLLAGHLVLAPANGQKLHNPNFKQPGPITHMLVIRGYDPATDEFITNDPGTRKGNKYRYAADVLLKAIVNYPTGDHLPQDSNNKAIIIVSR